MLGQQSTFLDPQVRQGSARHRIARVGIGLISRVGSATIDKRTGKRRRRELTQKLKIATCQVGHIHNFYVCPTDYFQGK